MQRLQSILISAVLLGICLWIVWRVPINGYGSLIWLLGNVVMAIVRRPHEAANKANVVTESRQTTTENLLLAGVLLGSAVLPAVHLTLGVFDFAAYSLPPWVLGAGALVLAFGLWLFWRSHADLGRNWSVTLEVREAHTLVDNGVYRRIRHPMYTAIFLIFAAQALLIHNWIAGLGGLVSFTAMYLIRVPREEAMMRNEFGEAYDAYCARTGRLLPR
ncbi:MAG: protein-S-isoprenylcysteine O-methyltransferase [Pseudomonadota bacterium]